jgi:uncharacterized protein YeaO (DUF488 family)
MSIAVKRIYEPAAKTDGFRVLVDRLWPRGLSKANARIDLWLPEIGPSTTLRRWFNHDRARWTSFRARYRAELREKRQVMAMLRQRARRGRVTLLYSARDERFNQAVALRTILARPAATRSSRTDTSK